MNDDNDETWHDTHWEGYQVSNKGRVRSLPRRVSTGRRIKGQVLKLTPNGTNYAHFTARVGGRPRTLKQLLRSAGLPEDIRPQC